VALALGCSLLGGCALVSGLSSLEVGYAPEDAAIAETSVDASREADADADVTDPFDADASNDAGDADADADASTCTVTGSNGSNIVSQCVTGNPIFQQGFIPPTSYTLTSLHDLKSGCNNYQPVAASGRLNVATQGSTYVLEERITIDGVTTERRYTATMANDAFKVTLTCGPPIATSQWPIYVGTMGGKTVIAVLKTAPSPQRFYWTQQ
jgi:hypothetical protein